MDMVKEPRSNQCYFNCAKYPLLLTLCSLPVVVSADQLTITPIVQSKGYWVQQRTNEQQNNEREGAVIAIDSTLATAYRSKRLELSGTIGVENIYRSVDVVIPGNKQDSHYFNLDARANVNLVENILDLGFSGRHYQQILNRQNSGAFSDKLLDDSGYIDAFDVQAVARLKNPTPTYIQAALNTTINARKTDNTDELVESNRQNLVDSHSQAVELNLSEGTKHKFAQWRFRYNTQKTNREAGGTVITEDTAGDLTLPLWQNFGLFLTANKNEFQVEGNANLGQLLDFEQYGAGLRWQLANGSDFSVTAYQSERFGQDKEQYLGGNFTWRVSDRSQLTFVRSANARGRTSELNIEQNNRYFRTRITASDGVTINTRQGFNSGAEQALVCPVYAQDLSACFQPTALDYELKIDERFVNVNQPQFDLSEELVDQSLGRVFIGYNNQRKLTASVDFSYTEQEGLETGAQNIVRKQLGARVAYQYSKKTSAGVNFRTSQTEYRADDSKDVDLVAAFTINSKLSRTLSLQTEFSYRDRNAQRQSLDTVDKRVSISIKYTEE